MSSDPITLQYKPRIAIITLNNPKKLNALNQDLYYLLGEKLREVAKRDDIYITILTGNGRYFSAYVPLSITTTQPTSIYMHTKPPSTNATITGEQTSKPPAPPLNPTQPPSTPPSAATS
jgi:hypothetical protein